LAYWFNIPLKFFFRLLKRNTAIHESILLILYILK
jgi:hypothetical protein